jgi:DUF971 family protein
VNIYPTKLELADGNRLLIDWSDGQRREYAIAALRDHCPCATCRERRATPAAKSLLPVLQLAEARPLTLAGMKPVGHYAYSIEFSDGHDTGIYTFELLRELGSVVEPQS